MAQGRGVGVSLTQLIKGLKEDLSDVRTVFLKKVAEDIAMASPVDTGTYAMGHTVSTRSSAGQFVGKPEYIGPQGQNKAAFREASKAKMFSEIDALPDDQTVVSISNSVGHAQIVEHRHVAVYGSARNKSKQYLQEAVQQVRAR